MPFRGMSLFFWMAFLFKKFSNEEICNHIGPFEFGRM